MKVWFTVENPWHVKNQDPVQAEGEVVFEHVDHVLNELHVHVFEAAAGAVEN